MCFTIKRVLKANRNIVCYKVLIKENGTLQSPYFFKTWELGEEQTEKLTVNKNKADEIKTVTGFYTYTNKKEAINTLRFFRRKTRGNFRVFKCIIPKSSVYYVSFCDEFCSDKLIIKRQLIFNLI